ncbi:MAG: ribonuclease III [Eubacterium sp.]|nr:ribonuclease III [Eubacterium sp.]
MAENLEREKEQEPEGRDSRIHPELYSPLALAYLGDAVLELAVREHFVRRANKQAQKYHKEVTGVVSAISQAAFMDSIEEELSGVEQDIYHRGRNASVHSKAKHATMAEYKKATGLEALIGYLYLTGEKERMDNLIGRLIRQQGAAD